MGFSPYTMPLPGSAMSLSGPIASSCSPSGAPGHASAAYFPHTRSHAHTPSHGHGSWPPTGYPSYGVPMPSSSAGYPAHPAPQPTHPVYLKSNTHPHYYDPSVPSPMLGAEQGVAAPLFPITKQEQVEEPAEPQPQPQSQPLPNNTVLVYSDNFVSMVGHR